MSMSKKVLIGTAAFAMLSAFTLGIVSAAPNYQTTTEVNPFDLLIATLNDASDKGLLSDNINDLLSDLFIENLIAPHTNETVEQVRERLSVEGQSAFQFLNAVLTDAYDKGLLSNDINKLLSDLFIENLIAPHTGETSEQVRERLSRQPSPDYIIWKIGDEVSRAARSEVRATVRDVHELAVSHGLPRIDRPITIFLYHDLDSLAAEFEETTGRRYEDWFWPSFKEEKRWIFSSRDFLAMNTSASEYQDDSPDERERLLARNMFDLYRRALTGIWEGAPRDAVSREGPRWLSEGYADYLAYLATRDQDPKSCDLSWSRYATLWEALTLPLSKMETSEGFYSTRLSYEYAFFAAELLAEWSGPESIFAYYDSLSTGLAWPKVFETTFGITLDEFYELFEKRASAGFPEPGIADSAAGAMPPPSPFSDLLEDPSLPSYIVWDIGIQVDRSDVESAIRSVRLVHEFGKSLGLPDPHGQIIFLLENDFDRMACYFARWHRITIETSRKYWEVARGNAGRGFIAIMPRRSNGEPLRQPREIENVMIHELVHANFQLGMAGLSTDPTAFEQHPGVTTPRWLSEGMAMLMTNLISVELLGIPHAGSKQREQSVSLASATDLTLPDVELWPEGGYGRTDPKGASEAELEQRRAIIDCIYHCGHLATELLASRVGVSKLAEYYMLLEAWMMPRGIREADYPQPGWRLAFEAAFGMTIDEFYELFEEHRAAGFPEMEIPKFVDR